MNRPLILFLSLFIFIPAVASPVPNDSELRGTLKWDPKCKPETAQVLFSADDTLIYQAEVPPNGSFSFHVVPGSYHIVALSPKACVAEKDIQLSEASSPSGAQQISLLLEPLKKSAPAKKGKGHSQ